MTIAYDGTDFHGWQRQRGLRTVAGTLEDALARLGPRPEEVQGASRTDQGVHARGQLAHARTESRVPAERFARALNGALPRDIRVLQAEEASPEFHARFSAIGKHYRYVFDRDGISDPFRSRYSLSVSEALDVGRMREAAERLVGERDFASFRSLEPASRRKDLSTVRTLWRIEVSEVGTLLALDIWGRSFLYKMVRTLAGTLLAVGLGRWTPERVEEILHARDRSLAGPTLPPQGLRLEEVFSTSESLAGSLSSPRNLDRALGGDSASLFPLVS